MWVHESIKARPYLKPSWGDSEGIQMVKISGPRGEYVFANCYIEPDRRGSGFFVDRSAVFEELNAEFKNIRGKGWYPFAMGDFNTHTPLMVTVYCLVGPAMASHNLKPHTSAPKTPSLITWRSRSASGTTSTNATLTLCRRRTATTGP